MGGALFLLVVATASGSLRHTLSRTLIQKAVEGPRRISVEQVECPARNHCVGIGGHYVLVEHSGKWRAVNVPQPPHLGTGTPIFLLSLACPAVDRCVAAGVRGEQRAIVLTQSGRTWRSAVVIPPPDPEPGSGFVGPAVPTLRTVSCGAAGDCAAVGYYYGSDLTTHALLVDQQGGTWGAGIDVQLPPDAATAALEATGGFLSSVACPSAGNCAAVGTYTTKDQDGVTYDAYPWALDETGGSWAAQGQRLQLPADAATTRDSRAAGLESPFLGFSGLSCPSAGNCTAVGAYVDRHSASQGVFFTERNGTWSQGIKAPVPAGAIPISDAQELDDPMGSISCAAPGNCAAIGWYFASTSLILHGRLLVERHGRWTASGLALPAGAHARSDAYLTSVECRPPGDCVAVGYYGPRDNAHTHGLVIREQGGRWGRPVNTALPSTAPKASYQQTFLNTVACPTQRLCLAGGDYDRTAGDAHNGLLLTLRFG
jgi:hypothetical protein